MVFYYYYFFYVFLIFFLFVFNFFFFFFNDIRNSDHYTLASTLTGHSLGIVSLTTSQQGLGKIKITVSYDK